LGTFPALSFLGYGKRFQRHRKLFHSTFSQAQCRTFEKTQTTEARALVKNLVRTPESYDWLVRRFVSTHRGGQFDDLSHRFATTLVMKIAYGHRVQSDDDEYIKIAERFSYALRASGSPGGTPPDFLPWRTFIGVIRGSKHSLIPTLRDSEAYSALVSWRLVVTTWTGLEISNQ
jgi:hypothetical protein